MEVNSKPVKLADFLIFLTCWASHTVVTSFILNDFSEIFMLNSREYIFREKAVFLDVTV